MIEDDYRGGGDAFERGEEFDPGKSDEWKAGWRDAMRDEESEPFGEVVPPHEQHCDDCELPIDICACDDD